MRQLGAVPDRPAAGMVARRIVAVLFAAWFVLSTATISPRVTSAAPPESDVNSASENASDPGNQGDDTPDTPPRLAFRIGDPDAGDATAGGEEGQVATRPASRVMGSIRPRGREAPVQLRQRAADPLDGEVEREEPEARKSASRSQTSKKREREQPARGIRIWPMPADSYTFTQAFGCVPQIAHFYRPGAGCPADAPVIHHGIDMAAPEGTPFYAAASGWVTEAGPDREVGVANTRIIVQHDDRNEAFATEYLHWIAAYVEVGDYVEAGEVIGEVGSVGYSTGPHLHFSIIDLVNGGNLDPLRWLPEEAGQEGYRGRLPRERAAMRLPAGTTAGVPEWHDPAPPPPPERQDVPESPPIEDRSDRKRKKRERRERQENNGATRNGRAADGAGSEAESAGNHDDTNKKKAGKSKSEGKDKERSRKRERNKNGQDKETAESGEDGAADKRAKRDNRGGKNKKKDNSRQGKKDSGKKGNNKSKDEKREKRKQDNKRDKVAKPPPQNEDDGVSEPPPDDVPPSDDTPNPDGDEEGPVPDGSDADEGGAIDEADENSDTDGNDASEGDKDGEESNGSPEKTRPRDEGKKARKSARADDDSRRDEPVASDDQVQQESSDSSSEAKRRKDRKNRKS